MCHWHGVICGQDDSLAGPCSSTTKLSEDSLAVSVVHDVPISYDTYAQSVSDSFIHDFSKKSLATQPPGSMRTRPATQDVFVANALKLYPNKQKPQWNQASQVGNTNDQTGMTGTGQTIPLIPDPQELDLSPEPPPVASKGTLGLLVRCFPHCHVKIWSKMFGTKTVANLWVYTATC